MNKKIQAYNDKLNAIYTQERNRNFFREEFSAQEQVKIFGEILKIEHDAYLDWKNEEIDFTQDDFVTVVGCASNFRILRRLHDLKENINSVELESELNEIFAKYRKNMDLEEKFRNYLSSIVNATESNEYDEFVECEELNDSFTFHKIALFVYFAQKYDEYYDNEKFKSVALCKANEYYNKLTAEWQEYVLNKNNIYNDTLENSSLVPFILNEHLENLPINIENISTRNAIGMFDYSDYREKSPYFNDNDIDDEDGRYKIRIRLNNLINCAINKDDYGFEESIIRGFYPTYFGNDDDTIKPFIKILINKSDNFEKCISDSLKDEFNKLIDDYKNQKLDDDKFLKGLKEICDDDNNAMYKFNYTKEFFDDFDDDDTFSVPVIQEKYEKHLNIHKKRLEKLNIPYIMEQKKSFVENFNK